MFARLKPLRAGLCGLLLLFTACTRPSAVPSAHGITYVLDWKNGKVEGTSGWEVTNDLGYRVHVAAGYLVTRSLELIPCAAATSPPLALLERLDEIFGPRAAYAGHSATPDPSATRNGEVESLLAPRAHSVATLYPGAQKYCQAHYLIARADRTAAGLPAEIDMVDQTLHLKGTYQGRDDAEAKPFAVTSALGNGKLLELPKHNVQEAFALDTSSQSAVVIVRRDLGGMFNHVDFATMADKRIGREVLQNLIAGTEIELRLNQDETRRHS